MPRAQRGRQARWPAGSCAQQAPDFDGLEKAFVQVPRPDGGAVVWDTFSLHYSGRTLRGYYGDIKIDLHDSDSIWNVDWETLKANGVAAFVDTNVGRIWAQDPGNNTPVVRK